MFYACVKAIAGNRTKATVTVLYLDERQNPPREVMPPQTYKDVDVSSNAKIKDWVASTIRPQLQSLKNAEEDAQLQAQIGKVLDTV